jgi:acyl-CoA hydrolase
MEVGVRVETENMFTGERHHTSSAYVVMVAMDNRGRPTPVPPIIAETPEEERRMAAAKMRRAQRKALHLRLKAHKDGVAQPPVVAPELVQTPE